MKFKDTDPLEETEEYDAIMALLLSTNTLTILIRRDSQWQILGTTERLDWMFDFSWWTKIDLE